jgi:hypothetical protein
MENQESSATPAPGIGTRILNVFAGPSEAFEGIPTLENKTGLWLIPFLVSCVLAVVSLFIIGNDDVLKGQIVDMQSKALQERVDSGQISQEQADQQIEVIERGGAIFIVFGSITQVFMLALFFFGGAFILWLVGKLALKSAASYGSYLATYGLASWIGILGGIVTVLMMSSLGSLYASLGGALAVYSDFDTTSTTHKLLARLEVFAIWQMAIVGLGLAKITGKAAGMAIGIAFGLWVLWVAAGLAIGLAM